MNRRVELRLLARVLLPLLTQTVAAAPVICSYGYQDSSCTPKLVNAPQTPPACPSSAGWTTAAAAQWIGSQYSAPQCQYQAPPSCAPGFIQSGPTWNGSSWVDLVCVQPAPPPPIASPTDEKQACAAALTQWEGFTPSSPNYSAIVNQYVNLMTGPSTGVGLNQFNGVVDSYASNPAWVLVPPTPTTSSGAIGTPSTNDMFYVVISGVPNYFCWLQPGTTTVTGMAVVSWCSANGGAVSCGGGGGGT